MSRNAGRAPGKFRTELPDAALLRNIRVYPFREGSGCCFSFSDIYTLQKSQTSGLWFIAVEGLIRHVRTPINTEFSRHPCPLALALALPAQIPRCIPPMDSCPGGYIPPTEVPRSLLPTLFIITIYIVG